MQSALARSHGGERMPPLVPAAAVPCDRRPRASSTPRLPPPQVPGCTLFLACCIGADPKLNDAARDVMRIRELVLGQAPDLA